MIEQDIINHLLTDTTLNTLLATTATDKKIYPIRATQKQQASIPFIVYSVSAIGVDFTNLLDIDRIELQVIHNNYTSAGTILSRLKILLEINDELRSGTVPTEIESTDYRIYSGRMVGGAEFQDPDTMYWIRVADYEFTYKRKI